MPNHITNILTIEEGEPGPVLAAIVGPEDKQFIDFNRVTPMPEIMKGDVQLKIADMAALFCGKYPLASLIQTSQGDTARAFKGNNYGGAADVLKANNILRQMAETKLAGDLTDDEFEKLVDCMRAYRQYGYTDWYGWSLKHWGTKWNAYDQEMDASNVVRFDTAWSMPAPIVEKLSTMFPSHLFRVQWADEDFGSNTGDVRIRDGKVVSGGAIENGSPEAHRNAVDVQYGGNLPDDMQWQADGTAEYVEA